MTEEVTGIDIVQAQIRLAEGATLAEAKELVDEGVSVLPLPMLPDEAN